MTTGAIRKLGLYADLVKFEHTIFALPFALSGLILGAAPLWPSLWTVLWVLLAMVGGRTFAMGLNRLIDRHIDAANPRTAQRAIPAGRVGILESWVLTLGALTLMVLATAQLPILCLQLLPVAVGILVLYSYVKRFSNLAHLVLGFALGSSAIGGWIAFTGALSWPAVLFGLAVLFWVAGFDIIYACQDIDFDRDYGLLSIPASFGIRRGLWLSRVCHILTVLFLAAVGMLYPYTGVFFWTAVLLAAAMLVYEQSLVTDTDLGRVNEAFFMVNGVLSVAFFILVLLDRLL